mgnify:CR=1 FL=1
MQANELIAMNESKNISDYDIILLPYKAEALKKMLAERGQEVSVMLDLDVPEEELIAWSEVSLNAGGPLCSYACERYKELFISILPEYADGLK